MSSRSAAGGAAKVWLLGLPAWRWMFLTETVPALVYLVGALQIPESPRYLVAIGRLKEAGKVLVSILGAAGVDAIEVAHGIGGQAGAVFESTAKHGFVTGQSLFLGGV